MEAISRAERQQQLTSSRFACVRKWDGLLPSAKVAWYYLWERAGQKPGTLCVHTSEVGNDQNVAYPERAGRNALTALREAKLIEVKEHDRGQWTFYLVDPVKLHNAILHVSDPDPQGELEFEEDQTPSPEIPVEDSPSVPFGERARSVAPAPFPSNSRRERITTNNPIEKSRVLESEEKSKGAGATLRALSPDCTPKSQLPTRAKQAAKAEAQRAAKEADPPTCGAVLMELVQKRKASFGEEVVRLQALITEVVASSRLYAGFAAKVANAAASNDRIYEELITLLDIIRAKFGVSPSHANDRRMYFCCSAARFLKKHQDSGEAHRHKNEQTAAEARDDMAKFRFK